MVTITDLENQYIEHTKNNKVFDIESAKNEIIFYSDLLHNIEIVNDDSFTSKLLMQGCRETIKNIFFYLPRVMGNYLNRGVQNDLRKF